MAKITALPDLEDLQHEPDNAMWSLCEHCETEPADFHVLCPARVLDYANRLVAEEQAKTRALLEGLRDRICTDAASLDRRSSSTTSANHHKAEQARKDARRLDEALTTLNGSDR